MLNSVSDSTHKTSFFAPRPALAPLGERLRRALLPGLVGLILGTALLAAGTAAADEAKGPRDHEPKILLHAVPFTDGKRINCFAHKVGGVEDVVTSMELSAEEDRFLVYILASDFYADWGIAGIQFGIAYNDEPGMGVDIDAWQDCADMEWHLEDWPLAGTGNLLTWHQFNNCQNEEPVVVGFFLVTVHSPDKFRLIPRPVDGISSIVSCGLNTTNSKERTFELTRDQLGFVEFGSDVKGYNPWDVEQFEAKLAGKKNKKK